MENVKVQITPAKDYTYPVSYDCRQPARFDNEYIVKLPSVIFEVISKKKTRLADTVDKFIRYQKIESLQHYTLVDSKQASVEVRVKQSDGSWGTEVFPLPTANFPFRLWALNLILLRFAMGSVFCVKCRDFSKSHYFRWAKSHSQTAGL